MPPFRLDSSRDILSPFEMEDDPLPALEEKDSRDGEWDAERWYDDLEEREFDCEMVVKEVEETSAATASSEKRGAEPIVLDYGHQRRR